MSVPPLPIATHTKLSVCGYHRFCRGCALGDVYCRAPFPLPYAQPLTSEMSTHVPQVFVGKYEGTIVAVKLLLGVDSTALQRFQREVAMLAGAHVAAATAIV